MFAHTLLAGLIKPDAFRFVLHPEDVADFPGGRPLETMPVDKLAIHKDAQGVILARKRDLKFYLDPVTGSFHLTFDEKRKLTGIVQNGKFGPPLLLMRLLPGDEIYGFGAANGLFPKKASRFFLRTIDTLFYSIPESSYSAFPFFMIRRGTDFFGVYLNCILPAKVEIDVDGSRRAEGPEVRFDIQSDKPLPVDVFLLAGTPLEILDTYSKITGRPFLPPAWALGFHQSRWSYKSQDRVVEVARRFREEDIPCDAVHLDIHYMDAYKVFTWNKKSFPDPKAMHEELNGLGVRTVAIVDPGVAAEEDYDAFESGRKEDAFMRDSMGNVFRGKVWPGPVVFPDFTLENVRKWWAHQHASLFRPGVSGIWNDMNEPVWRMGKKTEPLAEDVKFQNHSQAEMRNLYANLEAEATSLAFEKFKKDERPFILTRSAFCGIQKYAALWTGDNHSSFEQLKENLAMVLNLGLTGVPFCGADVGGFGGGRGILAVLKLRKDPELFARWMELGSLMPFFRAHTVLYSADQEPWSFGEQALAIARKHIKRRYRLMHYIYNLFHEAASSGAPIVRPVFFEFPQENSPADHFMLGPSLLAAPVLEKGAEKRSVTLPAAAEGWVDYDTLDSLPGGTYQLSTRPGIYPLFVRGGTALPVAVAQRNADDTLRAPLAVEIFPASVIHGSFILDDGKGTDGRKAVVQIQGKKDRNGTIQLELSVREQGFTPFQRSIRLRLPVNYRMGAIHRGKKVEGELYDLAQEDRLGQRMQFEVPLEDLRIEFDYKSS